MSQKNFRYRESIGDLFCGFSGIESPLETYFVGLLSIVERILCLALQSIIMGDRIHSSFSFQGLFDFSCTFTYVRWGMAKIEISSRRTPQSMMPWAGRCTLTQQCHLLDLFLLSFLAVPQALTTQMISDYLSFSHFYSLRASLVDQTNFYTVWRMNSDFYFLTIHFFKYTFQQILYPILYLI